MYTINQIIKTFEDIASAHKQIADFGYGDIWEVGASREINYPVMWVNVQPASSNGKELTYKFNLIFMDLVKKDESNELEVLSDQILIALDVLSTLDNPANQDNFIMNRTSSFEPFTERFDDEVSGWSVSVEIRVPITYDRCQIPSL